MNVAAVVLAAGASSRLGRPKQLVPFRGEALLRAVARQACGSRCAHVGVVVRPGDGAVLESLVGLPVSIVENADWTLGMAASIRRGVGWASERGVDAVVILACDQPALTSAHLDALLAVYRRGAPLVASRYAGARGIPALFARSCFEALLALQGAGGAKSIIESHPAAAAIDWPAGEFDVDTAEDAARVPP